MSPDAPVRLSRRVTLEDPLVIESPRIGFLNLLGQSAELLIEEDRRVLAPLFASIEQSTTNPPQCDVLMLYGRLLADGRVEGIASGLREIIRDSNAPIVIVASENEGENYIAADRERGDEKANLIMTLERKGSAFTDFFAELFRRMFAGESMLIAWVELAPQNPQLVHDNCPSTIFAAEVSHIIFRK